VCKSIRTPRTVAWTEADDELAIQCQRNEASPRKPSRAVLSCVDCKSASNSRCAVRSPRIFLSSCLRRNNQQQPTLHTPPPLLLLLLLRMMMMMMRT